MADNGSNVGIGSLSLEVSSKSEEAVKGLERLKETLGKLKASTNIGNLGIDKIKKLSDSLIKLRDSASGIRLGAVASGINKVGQAISSLGNDFSNLSKLTNMLQSLSGATRSISSLGGGIKNIAGSVNKIQLPQSDIATNKMPVVDNVSGKNIAGSIEPATGPLAKFNEGLRETATQSQPAIDAIGRLQTSLLRYGQSFGLANSKIIQGVQTIGGFRGMFDGFKKSVGGAATSFGKLGAAVSVFGKAMGILKIPISVGMGAINNLKNSIAGAIQKVRGFLGSLARIAMYRFVRAILSQISNAFKEGTQNAYQFSKAVGGSLASNLDKVASSMLYLKNSIGAAVAPLINALAPAIDFVISKLVSLINFVNQAFASLSGQKTWLKAKQYSTEYASAAGSAAKSSVKAGKAATKSAKQVADAVKKATLGIDELNIIERRKKNKSDPSGAVGGGGAGGPNYSRMFEEVPIENKISDFFNNIKSYIQNQDWVGLGRELGTRFNEMVEAADFKGFGEKAGKVINASVQTILTFLRTADFKMVGDKIGESFNSAMREIDFIDVGALISRRFLTLIDTVIGVLRTLDWKLLGETIGNFFIGLFDEISDWIEEIDWDSASRDISKKIEDFFEGVPWKKLAKSLARLLANLLKAAFYIFIQTTGILIGDALKGLTKALVGDGPVGEWVEERTKEFEKIGKGLAGGLVGGIVGFFLGGPFGGAIGAMIGTGLVGLIDIIKEFFGIHSPSTKMADEVGVPIADGILEGIKNGIKAIGGAIGNIASSLVSWFTESDVLSDFKKFGEDIVASLGGGIKDTYTNVKSTVSAWAENVGKWFTGGSGDSSIFGKFKKDGAEITSSFDGGVEKDYGKSKSIMETWSSSVVEWFKGSENGKSIFERFSETGKGMWESLKSGIAQAVKASGGFFSWVGSTVSGWFKPIVDGFTQSGIDCFGGYLKGFEKKAKDPASAALLKKYAKSALTSFNNGIKVESPSKLFMESGEYSIEGYNLGVEKEMGSTEKLLRTFGESLGKYFTPVLGVGVDSSELKYGLEDYSKNVSAEVNSKSKVSVEGVKEGIEQFFKEEILPLVGQMALDVRRQADKEEKTILEIDGAAVGETITRRQEANGYVFAR